MYIFRVCNICAHTLIRIGVQFLKFLIYFL